MRVHTKVVLEWKDGKYQRVESECTSFEYDGTVARAGGGGGDTVQKTEPPKYMRPYMSDMAGQAASLYHSYNPTYYEGSTVAPMAGESSQALDMQANRAMQGSDVTRNASQNAADTLGGNYLYGGAGFNAALDAASRRITPQVASMFSGAGRLNSGLAQTAQTQALSDAFASQYGQERNNQMQAMALSPTLANQEYVDASKLSEVGQHREGYAQQLIDDQVARHDFQQNLPYQKLQQYAGIINGINPGSVTTGQGPSRNRATGALGGAAAGASIGSVVPVIGTGLGAILGGLLGGIR